MKLNAIYISGLLALGLCVANPSASTAEDHHNHGSPKHRPKILVNLFSPQGRPVSQHQDHYRYVVPPASRYGAFYTYDDAYYYTPPAQRGSRGPGRPVVMEFGANKHQVELAERIESLANDFCLDLHHNYRHNPGFKEIYGEAYQLLQAAKFVHAKEHQGDREAIRRSATNIDNLFHHVQEEVSPLDRHEHRQIGQLSFEAKTEELQALIHHMLFDLGVKADHDHEGEQAPPPAREEAPPPAE